MLTRSQSCQGKQNRVYFHFSWTHYILTRWNSYSSYFYTVSLRSGTFGMEAVARQFATDRHVMVIRNGWFSFRWTEIFNMGRIPISHTVLKAAPVAPADANCPHMQYAPYPISKFDERCCSDLCMPSLLTVLIPR